MKGLFSDGIARTDGRKERGKQGTEQVVRRGDEGGQWGRCRAPHQQMDEVLGEECMPSAKSVSAACRGRKMSGVSGESVTATQSSQRA